MDESCGVENCTMFFFFNDTATTEIYTLSLHDALPIYGVNGHWDIEGLFSADARVVVRWVGRGTHVGEVNGIRPTGKDRKSTRLNSSHANISYAVFCLKKKKYINLL